MPDTWDEAACRARLAATTPGEWTHRQTGRAGMHNVEDLVECGDLLIAVAPGVGTDRAAIAEFVAHAPADLGAALAEIDRLRAKLDDADGVIAAATSAITEQLNRAVAAERECDRLRAALRPFAGFARSEMDPARMPTVADFAAAAAALGGRP